MRTGAWLLWMAFVLSSCAADGNQSAGEREDREDPCAAVDASIAKLYAQFEDLQGQLEALGVRPSAIPGTNDGGSDWWYENLPDDSDGDRWDNRTSAINLELRDLALLTSHVVVDHPDCFDPLEVARAKIMVGQ